MNPSTRRKLYVDADACPVKEEIVDVCQRHRVKTVFVSSYAHQMSLPLDVETIAVDSEKEAVDIFIVNKIKKDDICVTQDHALASLLLMKGAHVLSPRGHIFMPEKMDEMLYMRHIAQKERRAGNYTKGPKRLTTVDKLHFKRQLERCIRELD